MVATAEPVNVVVNDKVSPAVAESLSGIAKAARSADDAVMRLRAQLSGIDAAARATTSLTRAIDQRGMSYLRQETALNKAVLAEQRAQTALARTERAEQMATGAAWAREIKMQEAARATINAADAQARYNALLGVTKPANSARASASAFAPLFQKEDEEAAKRLAGALTSSRRGMEVYGRSVALTRMQMLTLQYTVNDVVASLASGANPLTILLQQGGQVTQAWGGLTNTLKAAAAALLSPIGLLTALGVATAGVVTIFSSAASEVARLNNNLALTGGITGLTAGSFRELARDASLAANVGIGTANEALSTLALSGKFAGDSLKKLTDVSLKISVITGKEASEVAKDFLSMSDNVTNFVVRWNEQHHLLTAAQISYIRLLEQRGQKEAAQAAASDAIYQAVAKVAVEQLGFVERAWRSMGMAAAATWEYIKSIGRDATVEEKIRSLQETLKGATGARTPQQDATIRQQLQLQLDGLLQQKSAQDGIAKKSAERAAAELKAVEAGVRLNGEWSQFNKNLDRSTDAIAKFQADLDAALAANPNDTRALQMRANQAAIEQEIRKSYNPEGVKLANEMQRAEEKRELTLAKLNLQLKNEAENLQLTGREQAIANDFARIEEQLLGKKIDLRTASNAALREEIMLKLTDNQIAKENAVVKNKPGEEAINAANQFASQILDQTKFVDNTAAMYARIDELRQADVLNEEQAARAKGLIQNAVMDERLQASHDFYGQLATLSSSSNKTLAAIGKAAAIAQATQDGILAVQKALSAYPPPWNFAMAAAVGVATAANVASIAGIQFKDGGLVQGPGGPRDDKVQARLSAGEFVVNAQATRANIALLRSINDGQFKLNGLANGGFATALPQSYVPNSSGGGGSQVNVQVHNYTGANVEVERLTASDVRIMIRKEAPKATAADLVNPNSDMSKAIERNTTAGRRR